MKRLYQIVAGVLLFAILVLGTTGCAAASFQKFEATHSLMDTFITVTVYASDEEKAEAAISAAFEKMEEIEQIASIFDEESAAFQLNRDGRLDDPPADLMELMKLSLDYSRLTDGYFDVTIQPLLELWEAGLWQEPEAVQQRRVSEALELTGPDKIAIGDSEIHFTEPGVEITLGGIAKGYAVDKALAVIKQMGIKHALINAGGDMAALGAKPDGEPWLVALVNPDDTTQSLANFNIMGEAIATSGNYERYFNPDKSAHHILNPKTGYSAQECISATVIAPTATQADALATSVFVMGPEAGVKLVESLSNVECLIVSSDRSTIYVSSGISTYLAESETGE